MPLHTFRVKRVCLLATVAGRATSTRGRLKSRGRIIEIHPARKVRGDVVFSRAFFLKRDSQAA